MALSALTGLPALALLSYLSVRLGKPMIIAIGGPVVLVLVHIGICIVLVQLAIALGLMPSIAYFVYFLALLWMLFVGSVQFFLLLLSS